jgi:hypothetical protein
MLTSGWNTVQRLCVGLAVTSVALTSLTSLGGAAHALGGASLAPSQAAAAVTTTSADPSGQPMPVGNQPGWRQVFADNFANETLPVGGFSRCGGTPSTCSGLPPSVLWGDTGDGKPDTSGHCQYWPSKTLSVAGGMMDMHVHTDASGVCMVANALPRISLTGSQTYGMYSIRFRADAVPGYKAVFLLWPDDGHSGEIDFPEGNLDQTMQAFLHPVAGGALRARYASGASWTSWHTATVKWLATSLTFILDGKIVGTATTQIPRASMHWSIRAESDLQGAPKPPATSAGNVQVDWASVWAYDPSV